jgi:microcystin-dependent protein
MANSMTLAGGNQPHDNMQPFLAVSFIISLFGIYPSQN